MASKMLRVVSRSFIKVPQRALATTAVKHCEQLTPAQKEECYPKIGKRDIVGFGCNGLPSYLDLMAFPFPAIRFEEPSEEIMPLLEKEKGDWHNLTIDERKRLYRYSFRMTAAEMMAPRNDQLPVFTIVFLLFGYCMALVWFTKKYIYGPMPSTFTEEYRQAMLQRMLIEKNQPINGVTSKIFQENEARLAKEAAAAGN